MSHSFFFPTFEACCNEMGFSGACSQEDVCGGGGSGGDFNLAPAATSNPTATITTTTTTATISSSGVGNDASNALFGVTAVFDEEGGSITANASSGNDDTNSCIDRQWHPDTSVPFPACTNTLDFPPYWSNSLMLGVTMFHTPEACCAKLEEENAKVDEREFCMIRPDKECEDKDGCEVGKYWHVDMLIAESHNTCTNNEEGVPEAWVTKDVFKGVTMFNTALDCCNDLMRRGESECKAVNICSGETTVIGDDTAAPNSPPTALPTPTPTKGPTAMPSTMPTKEPTTTQTTVPTEKKPPSNTNNSNISTDCTSAKWHPKSDFNGCTNDLNYPDSWADPNVAKIYMHDTHDACCLKWFETLECTKTEMACPPADTNDVEESNPISCIGRKWHPSTEFEGCSNSEWYPEEWNDPEVSMKYLFDDPEACCKKKKYFDCQIADECENIISHQEGAEWHPTLNFEKCSNSLEYPSSWNQPGTRDQFLHNTLEECCQQVFDSPVCPFDDLFPSPSSSPSSSPSTSHPTVSPSISLEPTRTPTSKPTSTPTQCKGYKWHHKGSTSQSCSNDKQYPVAWDNPSVSSLLLFDTPEECCEAFFSLVDCSVIDACGKVYTVISPPQPTTSPTYVPTGYPTKGNSMAEDFLNGITNSCKSNKWHPKSLVDRKCTNGNDDFPPLWSIDTAMREKFFVDTPLECCSKFYNNWECEIVDTCSIANLGPPEPSTENRNCDGRKWHPKSALDRTCTNDDNFPPIWKSDIAMRVKFLLDTAKECCDAFYSIGHCEIVNVC